VSVQEIVNKAENTIKPQNLTLAATFLNAKSFNLLSSQGKE